MAAVFGSKAQSEKVQVCTSPSRKRAGDISSAKNVWLITRQVPHYHENHFRQCWTSTKRKLARQSCADIHLEKSCCWPDPRFKTQLGRRSAIGSFGARRSGKGRLCLPE